MRIFTRPTAPLPNPKIFWQVVACSLLGLALAPGLHAQRSARTQVPPAVGVGGIPLINVGGDAIEAQFARLDFAQKYLEEQAREAKQREEAQKQNQKMVDSGTVSVLDLAAPGRAVGEFNKAAVLLKEQNAKDAIPHLNKALAVYPKFVSAHNNLGLAYLDLDQAAQARSEFETAARLDDRFSGSFVNLGRLALAENDFAVAEGYLAKALALRPRDANTLTALAYAQNGAHQYRAAISSAERVHALDHKGVASVHYVAAAAALALRDFPVVQRELGFFVQEDPTNALAPAARYNLEVLARNPRTPTPQEDATPSAAPRRETFPNSQRLKDQLIALGGDDPESCTDCDEPRDQVASAAPLPDLPARSRGPWTIRRVVEEVAVFFSVTSHGRFVTGLQPSDIQIRDDDKPPAQVLQFTPQTQLPLRLGLLVDTSGSVDPRFSFEKRAAVNFVQRLFTTAADLGFIAGFNDQPVVVQDFTTHPDELVRGIRELTNSGGTALFDAVSSACWKLAAYPERERVAKVLVVLSDGEDNSSHITLKQALRDAEATGVTVYTISTKAGPGVNTDADKIMVELAERSGGEALFPGDMMALGRSFDKLHELIRSRYMVAYKPADFLPDGRYRTIRIAAQQGGQRLQVHARKGYHARLENAH